MLAPEQVVSLQGGASALRFWALLLAQRCGKSVDQTGCAILEGFACATSPSRGQMPDHVLPYSWRHPRPPELALGDHATGLSTVHVNRTLQELRGNGLLTTPKGGASSLRIGRACKPPESSTPPTSTSSKRPSLQARTLPAAQAEMAEARNRYLEVSACVARVIVR